MNGSARGRRCDVFDVQLAVEDVAGDSVDASAFVCGVEALSATPPDAGTPPADGGFEGVQPGTELRFEVCVREVPPEPVPVELVLMAPGGVALDRERVEVSASPCP